MTTIPIGRSRTMVVQRRSPNARSGEGVNLDVYAHTGEVDHGTPVARDSEILRLIATDLTDADAIAVADALYEAAGAAPKHPDPMLEERDVRRAFRMLPTGAANEEVEDATVAVVKALDASGHACRVIARPVLKGTDVLAGVATNEVLVLVLSPTMGEAITDSVEVAS